MRMASEAKEGLQGDQGAISYSKETSPKVRPRKKNRNYWAKFRPEDFAFYPRMLALPYLTESRLIELAQGGDIEARNRLWEQHARLVYAVVNDFHIPQQFLADAVQEGVIGLKRAIELFDVHRYNAFSTYAWRWIWNHVRRFLIRASLPTRIPDHLFQNYRYFLSELRKCSTALEEEQLCRRWECEHPSDYWKLDFFRRISCAVNIQEVSLRDLPMTNGTGYEVVRQDETRELILKLLSVLVPREKRVIVRRFGLYGHREHTLQEVAEELGVTRERVRQLESRAIKRIRSHASMVMTPLPAQAPVTTIPSQPSVSSPPQFVPQDAPSLSLDEKPLNVEGFLMNIFRYFTFLQSNAVIHYYGLCGQRPVPYRELPELLDTTPQWIRNAFHRGRLKLIAQLKYQNHSALRAIYQQILSDDGTRRP